MTSSPASPAPVPDDEPEISCRAVASLALTFERLYGRDALREAYARVESPLPLEAVTNPENYVSFDFLVRITDALTEAADDVTFPRQAGLETASPRALGFVYYMLRAVGTPRLCYEQTLKLNATYNRVGRFEAEKLTDSEMLLRYTSSRPEPNRRICELRMAQFASFPTIWGLPVAQVVEHQCQVRGADSCLYDVRWAQNARPVLASAIGALIGAVTGGVLLGPALGLLLGSGIGVITAGLLGLVIGYRRQSLVKSELLMSQTQGLHEAAARQQVRFEEILELNARLEERVAERTRELEEARAKVQSALDKQVELDRLKTQFFQNISHELRTPLTLILAPLDSIGNEEGVPTRARQQVLVAQRNAERLLALINQLLDMSRLESGRSRLVLEMLDPARLVRHLVDNARPLAQQRGIEIVQEGPATLDKIPLDIDKFEKCLLNLISNALKFTTNEGGRVARVTVRADVVDGRLRVEVRDTGIGIAPDELEHVFERFHQVDGSDERRFSGTGIGLSLVRELVEFHCGTVTAESTLGEGSVFTLELPTTLEAYPPERLDRRRGQTSVAIDRRSSAARRQLKELIANPDDLGVEDLLDPPPPPDPYGKRPLLLIADDNADMRSYLATILGRDYDVITANDGHAAFDLALEHAPALVLSDVMMPGMNGHMLVRALRDHPTTQSTPIILLTAKSTVQQRVEGLEEGADDYLTKPFNFLELRARIRQLLKSRALERSLADRNDYLSRINFDLVLSRKEVFVQTIEAFALALETGAPHQHGHALRVAWLAVELGRALGLDGGDLEHVRIGAILHDIGKLSLPEGDPALETHEHHTRAGQAIIERVDELSGVGKIILHHHEHFDGTGTPSGLRGSDIPFESRLIAVANAYDALRFNTSADHDLAHAEALAELVAGKSTLFDPRIVEAFETLFRTPPVYPPELLPKT